MKKKILLTTFMLFFLASCGEEVKQANTEIIQKYVTTEIIEEKDFSENIKLPGKITSSKETFISSLSSGIINTINVNVGDKVKVGDILATIDTTSNLANINLSNAVTSYNNVVTVYNTTKESLDKNLIAAKLQYDNAVISRNNTYTNTEKQLELAKAQLDSVLTQKGNTNESSTTSLDLAEKSLENAALNLENFVKNSEETLKNLEIKKVTLIDNIKVTIEGSFILFDNSFTEIDKILGVTDLYRTISADYDVYLSAKDSGLKSEVKSIFPTDYSEYKKIKAEYNSNFTEEELIEYYSRLIKSVNNNIVFLDKMSLMLNNSVTGNNFSSITLEGMKTGITNFQSQFSTLKSNLVGLYNSYIDTVNSINSTKTNLDTQKNTLEQNIKIAQSTYDNTKATINTNLDTVSSTENTTRIQYESTVESVKTARDTADNNLEIAENQYSAAKANYDAQIASLKAQIDSSSGQKNTLTQQIQNSQIKAPYDGVIISRNIEIGSTIGQGSVAFIIANSTEKILKMDVNAENIKYLNIGKKVKLQKGLLGGEGTISLVGAGSNSTTGMYPIEITFNNNDNFGKGVILGDFVDVYIQKEIGDTKSIIVPFSALIAEANGIYHVYTVSSENIVEEKKVEIGSSNSSEVIIRSGLKVGDRIIVSGALNIVSGDKVEER